jgi:hypothetical protein
MKTRIPLFFHSALESLAPILSEPEHRTSNAQRSTSNEVKKMMADNRTIQDSKFKVQD